MKGIIDAGQIERLADPLTKNGYGQYLLNMLKQDVFCDRRGYFMETYQKNAVPFMIPAARAEFSGPIPLLVLTGP
jgi:hypothetical protein